MKTHERAQYVEVFSTAIMLSEAGQGKKHKDPAEWKKDERLVNKFVEAIKSFMNPFDLPGETKLYCLFAAAVTSTDIERYVLRAEQVGEEAKEQFIKERLEKKERSLI